MLDLPQQLEVLFSTEAKQSDWPAAYVCRALARADKHAAWLSIFSRHWCQQMLQHLHLLLLLL
jgi:hypothetical protein